MGSQDSGYPFGGIVVTGVGDEGALGVLVTLCFSVQILLHSYVNFVKIHQVVPWGFVYLEDFYMYVILPKNILKL